VRIGLAAIGGVMVCAGLLFTLQGLDYVKGSEMSGVEFWAIAGPLIAGLGVALMIVGLQRRRPGR
jgi:drug/metabolite transporter superfamily protein YnfA